MRNDEATSMVLKVRFASVRYLRKMAWVSISGVLAIWGYSTVVSGVYAQDESASEPAEKVYKNIQVLKGLPSTQLMSNMFYMEGALGVGCGECHVNFTDFEKDDNPHKQVARRMIEMVRELNAQSFGGQNLISCNTCHRGRAVPDAPLAFAVIKNSTTSSAAVANATSAPTPTVDQIFDRYVSAALGEHARSDGETVLLTGSMLSSDGWTAPLKIYVSGNDQYLATFDIGWISYHAFSGATAWSQDNHGVHDVTGKELAQLRRDAALFRPLVLRRRYSNVTLKGQESSNGEEAYVVEGVLPNGDRESLYFSRENALLVRIRSGIETSLGILPQEIDLSDYRDVAGMKIPFRCDRLAADFSSAYRISEVRVGVQMPVELFKKPPQPLKTLPR